MTLFQSADFDGTAAFDGVYGKEGSSFSLARARFARVPSFIQAHFVVAPRLDNVRVDQERTTGVWTNSGDIDLPARWRNLKRLAIEAHDGQREMDFFAGEIKAQRGVDDFAYPRLSRRVEKRVVKDGKAVTAQKRDWLPRRNVLQFYFGWLYQIFSDFGRSTVRPVLIWLLLVLGFAVANLSAHFAAADRVLSPAYPVDIADWAARGAPALACVRGAGDPLAEALYLSLGRGLVVGGLISGPKLPQTYACLYGINAATTGDRATLPAEFTPRIPGWVSYLGVLQLLLSLTLITLFLLALRNQFRIR